MGEQGSEAVLLAQHGLGDRAVTLTPVFEEEQPLVVRANRERLMQVLTNIVLNATQATPDGGAVTVRAEHRNGSAVLAVHNTGSYIPPQMRRQLFVPFFTTKPSGTGLGLAFVDRIVSEQGGSVTLGAAPGGGAQFEIRLPLEGD